MPDNSLPNMALIAPHENLPHTVRAAVSGLFNLHIFTGYGGSYVEACEIAKNLDPEYYDIIISRGGTVDYISKVTNIPVVSVQTSIADLIHSLLPYKNSRHRVAFFNYMYHLPGVRELSSAIDMLIDEYTFIDIQDITNHIQNFKPGQYDLFLGGILLLKLSAQFGFTHVLVENRADSVEMAVREAKHVVEIKQKADRDLVRMKAILGSIAEGIVVTDESNKIILLNGTAQKILALSENAALGNPVDQVIQNSRIKEVLLNKTAELTELQDIGSTSIITSRVPIFLGDNCIGVVCSFNDTPHIQKAERIIRKKMLAKSFVSKYSFDDILTKSPKMHSLIELAKVYAKTESSVMLYGESGTGKELFAQSLHSAGERADGPFVAINCAAIPATLLESELFGYEGGAFTGAKREGKAGLIEMSHGGTLFLDEIGEFPLPLQSRLLRVLQEHEIMRVGGKEVIPVDIRIIGATNLDLQKMSEGEVFRKDLFYRLNVLPITLPPLRERREDLPYLVRYFMGKNFDKQRCADFLADFATYNWPGNIRELKSIMERLGSIAAAFPKLPWQKILALTGFTFQQQNDPLLRRAGLDQPLPLEGTLKQMVRGFETQVIKRCLEVYGNDRELARKQLGISKMSMWRKLNQL